MILSNFRYILFTPASVGVLLAGGMVELKRYPHNCHSALPNIDFFHLTFVILETLL